MSKRLTFCSDLIEPLGDENYFRGVFHLYIYMQIYYWAIKDKLLNKKENLSKNIKSTKRNINVKVVKLVSLHDETLFKIATYYILNTL